MSHNFDWKSLAVASIASACVSELSSLSISSHISRCFELILALRYIVASSNLLSRTNGGYTSCIPILDIESEQSHTI